MFCAFVVSESVATNRALRQLRYSYDGYEQTARMFRH